MLVKDGAIARVGPASEVGLPPGATAIDLTGHTLMPGLSATPTSTSDSWG